MNAPELPHSEMPRTAVVLAGGLGTRLQAAITGQPKVLAPAAGRPFLSYVLAYLARQGVRKVILSTGYLGEQVQAFAGDGRAWGLQIDYSQEETPLGTGGALRQTAAGLQGPFFGLNGDTLFQVDLLALYAAHRRSGALATIALLQVGDGRGRGCVRLEPGGRIAAFDEKPQEGKPALVNGGVYVLEAGALADLAVGQPASLEREVFPRLAARDQLAGQVQSAYFADIGTPDSLAAFEQDLLAGKVQLSAWKSG